MNEYKLSHLWEIRGAERGAYGFAKTVVAFDHKDAIRQAEEMGMISLESMKMVGTVYIVDRLPLGDESSTITYPAESSR